MADSSPEYRNARLQPIRVTESAGLDFRTPGQRDRDRVLYTSAFRRLAGVTQVVSSDEGHVFHNRLTHTLEVAQVARRIAEKLLNQKPELAMSLGGLDPDVAEAAALAHDLGHPPFGHVGEDVLNKLVEGNDPDGFEGNPQSFRIVNHLALRSPYEQGLNLTRATLRATLKYPWLRRADDKKRGAYRSESKALEWAVEGDLPAERRSLEAEIMDWSDDVTYAVHDMSDFYRAGLIPLELLTGQSDKERKRFFEGVFESPDRRSPEKEGFSRAELEKSFEVLMKTVPLAEKYTGTSSQRGHLRAFTAGQIAVNVSALEMNARAISDGTHPRVIIDSELKKRVIMLKQLTWHYVILDPSLRSKQFGQEKVLTELFKVFANAAAELSRGGLRLFPYAYHDLLQEAANQYERIRLVTDMIASMTEEQANRMYLRLIGVSSGSALDHMN
jgi:dGTPase